MTPIIKVENLSKQYRIGSRQASYATLRTSLAEMARAPMKHLRRNGRSPAETIWALKDVSFEVMLGEVVGIIGRNGAGKSTLLKILSRITEPTSGGVDLHGRVGSLLEVGTGFHAELTGRENIYLNGAILGMKKTEIDHKFDEIVAFAEIERFIDTAVKHYSSGMYMRLAFSVAAHLEPEILLVDEVLAVGDSAFQRKCLGKMGDVAKEGRTVLFVSHNMSAVQSLCKRAIWLQDGKVKKDGQSDYVVAQYLKNRTDSTQEKTWDEVEKAPGNELVRLRSVCILPEKGNAIDILSVRTPFTIEVDYVTLKEGMRLNISMLLYNQERTCVFASTTVDETKWDGKPFPLGLFRSVCQIPGNLLNEGIYSIALLIVKDTTLPIHSEEDALVFEVHDDGSGRGDWYGKWPGVVRPNLEWHTDFVSSLDS